MNKQRRTEIDRAIVMIDEARSILEGCAQEERDYYDNMPEAIQAGERGDRANEVADALDEAVCALEDIDLSDALS